MILSIPDPGSRIQQQQQNRRWKKCVVLPCQSHVSKNSKIKTILFFEKAQKKFSTFTKSSGNFYPKIVTNFKNMGWGSEIRNKPIPDPGPATLL
jgi:hypothetical protein